MTFEDLTKEQLEFLAKLGLLYIKNIDPELWPNGFNFETPNISKKELIKDLENVRTRELEKAL